MTSLSVLGCDLGIPLGHLLAPLAVDDLDALLEPPVALVLLRLLVMLVGSHGYRPVLPNPFAPRSLPFMSSALTS